MAHSFTNTKGFNYNILYNIVINIINTYNNSIKLRYNRYNRMYPIDCRLLNIVLNTGFVPTDWCLGTIHPLYKNKGSVLDPDNYRSITLLSCTGKLFTTCQNHRLSSYVDDTIL